MTARPLLTLKIERSKQGFFDRPAVLRRVEAARRRNLSRLGAFVRTRAISLLLRHFVGKGFGAKSKVRNRHQGETAPAGQAPYAHTGELARFLFFGWDQATESAVVGPALLNKAAPALRELEQGGVATIAIYRGRGRDRRLTRVRASFQPHPFMRPALEDVEAQAPKVWQNTIR